MNIFSALQVYMGKWSEKSSRPFSSEEIAAVQEATVVESQYGFSVCFLLKAGGTSYIPLEGESTLTVGDHVDLSTAKLVTLERQGDEDIYRVRA